MALSDARHGKLADNIVGFGRTLRRAGLAVDSQRIDLALRSAQCIEIGAKADLRAALATVFVSRQSDLEVFHQLFDATFRDPKLAQQLIGQLLPRTAAKGPQRKPRAAEALVAAHLVAPERPREEEVELDAAMSANAREALRHADFNALSASEFRLVERLARDVGLPVPCVPGRRMRPGHRGSRLDWSRLAAHAARQGGEWLDLPRLQRRPQPLPLLILVDVSGSMERYARLLLAFLHRATRRTRRHVFAFGTHLTPLDHAFAEQDTDRMLERVNADVSDYAGGTRIGAALSAIRTEHRRRLVGRRTLTLLISDGLDTGRAEALERELLDLRRHTRHLLWLNPLLRFDAYQPLAAGAQVLARHADAVVAVHNLMAIEALAGALARLLQHPRLH